MDKVKVLQKLRSASDNLSRAVINNNVEVNKEKREVEFLVITDKVFTTEDIRLAENVFTKNLPEGFKANVTIQKINPDMDMFERKLLQIVKENYPSIASGMREGDLKIEKIENGFAFTFCVDEIECGHFKNASIIENMIAMLSNNFCGEFKGNTEIVEKEFVDNSETEDAERMKEEMEVAKVMTPRTFNVEKIENIDGGNESPIATCICDCNHAAESMTICGKIKRIEERETKTGKTFYSILINDTTGDMKVTYWIKQKTLDRIKALKEGDSIVCFGANEVFNGYLSYKAKFINKGCLPENFELPKRPSLPVPAKYKTILPQQYKSYTQNSLFGSASVPPVFQGKSFVVFDLETTGLNNTPDLGSMDTITEIGAVKIVDGEICEKFSTLVNPKRRLTPENIAITGITDDMVKDAPELEEVLPDFFKFASGSNLVGHNSMFDYRFIDYYGQKQGYIFTNKLYDTLPLAQKKLRLVNNKLNTIADYYHIEFEHHRAFNDALATAKIFIELLRDEKELPDSLAN